MRYWLFLAALFLLFMAYGMSFQGGELLDGKNDFAPVYAALRLVGTPYMYDADKIFEIIIEQIGGTSDSWRYTRLPFHALFLWPLGQLPYRTAYALYLVLQVAAVVAFAVLWRIPSRSHAVVFTLLSMPVFFSLLTGQDTVFLLLWVALAVRWESRGQPFRAGMILAMCAIKFHLFLFLPLLLLAHRRWSIAKGLAAGGTVLVALSFFAAGASWPLDYYRVLTDSRINPWPPVMVNLHGMFYGLPGALPLELAGDVVIAAATWFTVRRVSFQQGLAVICIAGLITSFHGYTGDCVLLLPAGLILNSTISDRWVGLFAILFLTPPLYFLLLSQVSPFAVQISLVLLFASVVVAVRKQARAEAPAVPHS